jgi:hypothetical protein
MKKKRKEKILGPKAKCRYQSGSSRYSYQLISHQMPPPRHTYIHTYVTFIISTWIASQAKYEEVIQVDVFSGSRSLDGTTLHVETMMDVCHEWYVCPSMAFRSNSDIFATQRLSLEQNGKVFLKKRIHSKRDGTVYVRGVGVIGGGTAWHDVPDKQH